MKAPHISLFARNAIIAFLITLVITGTVIYAINYLNQQRLAELNTIEDQLSTDTLSIETQYALIEDAPCQDFVTGSSTEDTALSQEVSNVGDQLSFAEDKLGDTDPQVIQLKEQYTLLEIRDYLLTEDIAKTCHVSPTVVLYFYSNDSSCTNECDRAGYALSYLHQTYPSLRVYSFDYNLNLGALKTLESIEKVKSPFPAFVINHKVYNGFTNLTDFEKNFPSSLFATSTATTSTIKK
ncbi:MAG: hypothetical protein P4M11_00660 [Candidatus Pacebacteria bacterium]|nr:hypothetical protein [Candidatus Paceibacterota bacterium]